MSRSQLLSDFLYQFPAYLKALFLLLLGRISKKDQKLLLLLAHLRLEKLHVQNDFQIE